MKIRARNVKAFAAGAALLLLQLTGAAIAADAPGALRIGGAVARPASVSAAELEARPRVTQQASFQSSKGAQSHAYLGTPVWELLRDAGIDTGPSGSRDALNRYVLATGADGYQALFSLGELHPDFGAKPSLVAYGQADGQEAPAPGGPLRLTAPGDAHGGRYVAGLVALELREPGAPVVEGGGGLSPGFTLSGVALASRRFDLAALKALPAESLEAHGSRYTGVGLWTLLQAEARPEAGQAARPNASLRRYALATGSDGYRALVSLGEIDPAFGGRKALVAYEVNGQPLDRNGMARLVVEGDKRRGRTVSNLATIEVFDAR